MIPLSPFRRLVPIFGLALALAACGDDDSPAPDANDGVSASLLSRPVGAIEFQRFALRGWLKAWEEGEGVRPGASWSYDDAAKTWKHDTSAYSTVYVGVAGGGSTEVRVEYRNRITVAFTHDGSPVADILQADRMTLAMADSVRHYVLDPEVYSIDDPYAFVTTGAYALDVTDGHLEAVAGSGEVEGWERSDAEGPWAVFETSGLFTVSFGYAGGFDDCAAEGLQADLVIRDDAGVELDRYAGSFSVAAGGPVFTGFLESEEGPGRYGINGGRSCP